MALQVRSVSTFLFVQAFGIKIDWFIEFFLHHCKSKLFRSSSFVSTSQSCLYRLSDRDSAIAFSDRIKSGVVGEQLWLQITEPTEKDMGKYAIEFNDGKGGLRRTVELSGQGEANCMFETLSATVMINCTCTVVACFGRSDSCNPFFVLQHLMTLLQNSRDSSKLPTTQ